jgi:hypothetical protein
MKSGVNLILCALIMAPIAASAADQSTLNCVTDFKYNPAFLERFPDSPSACRQVIDKGGQRWARFDADVVQVGGGKVTVRFVTAYNHPLPQITLNAKPYALVTVDGKPSRYSQIKEGERISFWVSQDHSEFYSQPLAEQNDKLAVIESPTLAR